MSNSNNIWRKLVLILSNKFIKLEFITVNNFRYMLVNLIYMNKRIKY